MIGAVVDDEDLPFQVLADPEGNEFCLVGVSSATTSAPT